MIDRDEILRAIKPSVVGWVDDMLASRGAQGAASTGGRFAPSPHNVAGSHHSESGLTVGQVLRATGASSFAWGTLQSTDLPNPLTSSNYVANYSGWALRQDGSAEFGNVIIRGVLRGGVVQSGEVQAVGATLVVMQGHALAAGVTSV